MIQMYFVILNYRDVVMQDYIQVDTNIYFQQTQIFYYDKYELFQENHVVYHQYYVHMMTTVVQVVVYVVDGQ